MTEGVSVSETTKSAGARSRVLVVDDDAALAEMLSIVLRNEGFEPIWCAHGDKAFSAFKEAKPDLVLLDLMLPGRDGVDVCRDIRSESGVPIVMLTAKTDTIDVVEGLEAGADDYVAKPFKAKELVARIKIRLRRMRRPKQSMSRPFGSVIFPSVSTGIPSSATGCKSNSHHWNSICCSLWPGAHGRCSAGKYCWSRSGATGTPPIRDSSTSMYSGCGPRSRGILSIPRSW
jgi:CheY-like chemotaxis protein